MKQKHPFPMDLVRSNLRGVKIARGSLRIFYLTTCSHPIPSSAALQPCSFHLFVALALAETPKHLSVFSGSA